MGVIPGEMIGTEEEYIPGKGTYSDEEGIYASVAGELHIDKKRHATILPYERIPEVRIGSVVYGRVEEIFESKAFVSLEFSETNKKKRTITLPGIIPVSEIKMQYVRSIRDELRVGDIVKGTVVKITPFNVEISLKPRGMGVVKSFCSRCRHELTRRGRILECSNCGNKESRKMVFK